MNGDHSQAHRQLGRGTESPSVIGYHKLNGNIDGISGGRTHKVSTDSRHGNPVYNQSPAATRLPMIVPISEPHGGLTSPESTSMSGTGRPSPSTSGRSILPPPPMSSTMMSLAQRNGGGSWATYSGQNQHQQQQQQQGPMKLTRGLKESVLID